MNIFLGLLTIDELNDMIMFKTFHNGDFALEVLKEFTCEFRTDDRFDSDYGGFTLIISDHVTKKGCYWGEGNSYHVVAFGDDGKRSSANLLSHSVHSYLFVEHGCCWYVVCKGVKGVDSLGVGGGARLRWILKISLR